MLNNVTNHLYCQVDALSGGTVGGTDKKLWKSECQSKPNATTDTNWVSTDCLLVGGWCIRTVALIS